MATKVRLIKLSSATEPVTQVPVRRPALKPVVLYLMELRSHTANTRFGRKKFAIPVVAKPVPAPQRIKIVQATAVLKSETELAAPSQLESLAPIETRNRK
ncbi:MAG: hypothetical protein NZ739_08090 [Verrucomicrobiae bacterium]|nr:hypothetical protein [Verrucomicrobiae bacterium]MCX7722903.1 hypothetical protein [Verrucomicrobiae bacterium]MDW7979978.1 hypothetical protein [Verrucomicrobiales bacterium]